MVLEGVLAKIIEILSAFVPVGVQPVYFYATFLIVFSLTYILIGTVGPFKDKKFIAFLVALVFGYFAAGSAAVTVIISKLFPSIGLVIMALLGLLLVIALIAPSSFEKGTKIPFEGLILIGAFVFIIWATYTYAAPELVKKGFILPSLPNLSETDWAIIIIGIIAIFGIYYMVKPKTEGGTKDELLNWLLGGIKK